MRIWRGYVISCHYKANGPWQIAAKRVYHLEEGPLWAFFLRAILSKLPLSTHHVEWLAGKLPRLDDYISLKALEDPNDPPSPITLASTHTLADGDQIEVIPAVKVEPIKKGFGPPIPKFQVNLPPDETSPENENNPS